MFSLGASLVALVGTNIGAGQRERALLIALTGGALSLAITETFGIAAAIWPEFWINQFGKNPRMLETGISYLRYEGPIYGFFGLGLSLYFASRGAGRLSWPLLAGMLRMMIAVGGGWAALSATASLEWAFVALAMALVLYGVTLAAAIASGVWSRR